MIFVYHLNNGNIQILSCEINCLKSAFQITFILYVFELSFFFCSTVESSIYPFDLVGKSRFQLARQTAKAF